MFNFWKNKPISPPIKEEENNNKKKNVNEPIQDCIDQLMVYTDQNEFTAQDVIQIANLLFDLGRQPLSEFTKTVTDSFDQRRKNIENIETDQDVFVIIHSQLVDALRYQDILMSLYNNYLSDPYSFTMPRSIHTPEEYKEFITEHRNFLETEMQNTLNLASEFGSIDQFISHIQRENLLSLYQLDIANFMYSRILINIHDRDTAFHSIHYMLQDVLTEYASHFDTALLCFIYDYAEKSVDDFLKR